MVVDLERKKRATAGEGGSGGREMDADRVGRGKERRTSEDMFRDREIRLFYLWNIKLSKKMVLSCF